MGFDVWLSAMSCVDVLYAAGDCVLKQRSQPAAVSIPLYIIVTIVQILMRYSVRCK